MRKSRFTEEQMVRILRDADKAPLPEVANRHGVSEATLHAWRKRFGTLDVPDTKRLKALEAENARLKRLLAERDLEISPTTASSLASGLWAFLREMGQLAADLYWEDAPSKALSPAVSPSESGSDRAEARSADRATTRRAGLTGSESRVNRTGAKAEYGCSASRATLV